MDSDKLDKFKNRCGSCTAFPGSGKKCRSQCDHKNMRRKVVYAMDHKCCCYIISFGE